MIEDITTICGRIYFGGRIYDRTRIIDIVKTSLSGTLLTETLFAREIERDFSDFLMKTRQWTTPNSGVSVRFSVKTYENWHFLSKNCQINSCSLSTKETSRIFTNIIYPYSKWNWLLCATIPIFFSSLNPFWFNFSKKSSISSIFYLTVIFDYPIHSLVPWVSDNGAFTVNGYSSYYIIKYRPIIRSILLISLGMGGRFTNQLQVKNDKVERRHFVVVCQTTLIVYSIDFQWKLCCWL